MEEEKGTKLKEPRQAVVRVRAPGDSHPTTVIGTLWDGGDGFDLTIVSPDGGVQTMEVNWEIFSALEIIGTTLNYTGIDVEVLHCIPNRLTGPCEGCS